MDARSAPTRIGQAHFSYEVSNLVGCTRTALACSALPAPIEAKSLSAPGDDCVGVDDADGGTPNLPEAGSPNTQSEADAFARSARTGRGSAAKQQLEPARERI